MSVVVDFSDEDGGRVTSWIIRSNMSPEMFVRWLHGILVDEETYGLDIIKEAHPVDPLHLSGNSGEM